MTTITKLTGLLCHYMIASQSVYQKTPARSRLRHQSGAAWWGTGELPDPGRCTYCRELVFPEASNEAARRDSAERDGTRAQWNDLIPILVKYKYAVLAPDLRSFGESNKIVRDGQEEPYQFGSARDAVLDMDAALRWLQPGDDVDLGRIGIIDSRLGADLAYLSTGGFAAIRAGVCITPDPYTPDDPRYSLIPDFAAHDVFIMAGCQKQWEEAVTLGVRVTCPKGRRYLDTPDLEGVGLLANDDVIRDILEFFKTRFAIPRPSPPANPRPTG